MEHRLQANGIKLSLGAQASRLPVFRLRDLAGRVPALTGGDHAIGLQAAGFDNRAFRLKAVRHAFPGFASWMFIYHCSRRFV